MSRKSTQKDVVKEVKALSALLYAAAISPKRNTIPIVRPKSEFNAISGNKRSVLSLPFKKGIEIPV